MPEFPSSHLVAVATFREMLTVRRIRNQCREFMTGDQSRIGLWKQFRYWNRYRKGKGAAVYLQVAGNRDHPVGYGIIRTDRDGLEWLSGGVDPTYQGLGFGKELFAQLRDRATPAMLDVLCENKRAVRLYDSLGFKVIGWRKTAFGPALVMYHTSTAA